MDSPNNKFDPKLIEDLFLNSAVEISLYSFIASIISAAILAYLIKKCYVAFSKSLSNRDYFSDVFIPLSVITCLVITVVKFSLALSLGLVGALSIVRFRAAIKEPEELVYLFFCVGIGIATGANQILVGLISTIIIIFILFMQSFLSTKKNEKNINYDNNNIIKITINNKKLPIEKIVSMFEKFTVYLSLKSSFFEKNHSQYIFTVEFKNKKSYLDIIKVSENLSDKNIQVSFYSNSKIRE